MFGAIQSVAAAVLEAAEPALSDDMRAALHNITDGEAGPADGGGQAVDAAELREQIDAVAELVAETGTAVVDLTNERDLLRAERAELRADVATLRATVAELGARVAALETANTTAKTTRASGGK